MLRRRLAVGAAVCGGVTLLTATPAFGADGLTTQAVKADLDNAFVLIAATLVIFMQAGFALVEAGLTRAKSVANIMMKNLMDFMAGALAFFAVGFALAFGTGNSFVGWKGFFLGDGAATAGNLDVMVFFVFQLAFAATAATIVSGAMAERTKFKSYFVYSLVITSLIYPVVVHWVWGGGWLSTRSTPMIDFAGSTVVHATGGIAALMGAIALGPRIGKFGADGKARVIHGHSVPFVVLGTFILLVGWYGFNPGSQLAADGAAIGLIATTTTLAAAAGSVATMFCSWIASRGKPDVGMAANGALAGLVGITAGCASVSTIGAICIGAICGVTVYGSIGLLERFRVDDPVSAVSVHGTCGLLGTVLVGFFATETGLLYGGGADQLVTQIIGVVAVTAWVAATAGILFAVIKATMGLRVGADEEHMGLDLLEHGARGYNPEIYTADFVIETGDEMVPISTLAGVAGVAGGR